ncbi:hypothetical protein [Sphingomonas faeni]|uniref:hypothetical protein n=1 Tax=Sphingomonas faeni TaxID=185950 RepID=UPI0033516CDC
MKEATVNGHTERPLGNVLVLDLETAPDPMALRLLAPRERTKGSSATHRIAVASMLKADELTTGGWRVASVGSVRISDDLDEIDVIIAIDKAILAISESGGTLITYNGNRHDLVMIRMRAAAHMMFELQGVAALARIKHRDLMTESIAAGGQWFKLRDVAAGLGIPVAHEVANAGIGTGSRSARKGEVDVAVTFLVFLHDLAHRRSEAGPVLEGWRALGDHIRRAGPLGEHLAQFRRHPLGRGRSD